MKITRLIISLFLVASTFINALKFAANTLEGTETGEKLTDKQLAIQRWFSDLTYLRADVNDWAEWGDSVKDIDCDGNTCIRYEIAGLAYAAAILGLKTPAYHQVSEAIMYNSILRMTQQIVWQYVELFDDFKSQSSYPDPVAYKNIMYSGHLVQMISLFEVVFGNYTFSTDGWDFVWTDQTTNEVEVLHYNTSLLMERVYQQSVVYDETGGVPCEPDSIFIICNNYPQNGWLIHDSLHGMNYTAQSIPAWHKSVKYHGINHLLSSTSSSRSLMHSHSSMVNTTANKNNDSYSLDNFFKLDYLIKPLGIWEPVGNIGSDLWAMGWMKTWWPVGDIEATLTPAFESIMNSSCWTQVKKNNSDSSEEIVSYSYLHSKESSQKIFPFSDFITTSFYPMIEKQFLPIKTSQVVQKYQQVMNYFESEFGEVVDLDGDSIDDAYRYNTGDNGDYSIWGTANLLIGMLHPSDDLDYLRRIFQNPHHSSNNKKNDPFVESVEYPSVMVSYAQYSFHPAFTRQHNLTTMIKPGDHPPVDRSHSMVFSQISVASVASDSLLMKVNEILITDYEVIYNKKDKEFVRIKLNLPGWNEETVSVSQEMTIELTF
jgi:hypothetical protein